MQKQRPCGFLCFCSSLKSCFTLPTSHLTSSSLLFSGLTKHTRLTRRDPIRACHHMRQICLGRWALVGYRPAGLFSNKVKKKIPMSNSVIYIYSKFVAYANIWWEFHVWTKWRMWIIYCIMVFIMLMNSVIQCIFWKKNSNQTEMFVSGLIQDVKCLKM